MELLPDLAKLNAIFSHAASVAFFLGAVAAFTSLMSSRLSTIVDRLRILSQDTQTSANAAYIERLFVRATLLGRGISLSLASGICTTILLALLALAELLEFKYAIGAGFLFFAATALLGAGLACFVQEIRLGLREVQHYRSGALSLDS